MKNEKVYYVGFNANNAICNEDFFEGSLTLYPTKEKGNISFFKSKSDTQHASKEGYNLFVKNVLTDIINKYPTAKIMFFNEKAKELCKEFRANFSSSNDDKLLSILNDKYIAREIAKRKLPILNYIWLENLDKSYEEISKEIKCNHFVVQSIIGAGGNTTYNISCEKDYLNIKNRVGKFCISKYIEHVPLNVTAIIADKNIVLFPVSAQLILANSSNFTYVGGDFIYPCTLPKKILANLTSATSHLLKILKKMGYRGIVGIDYMLTEINELFFMEINPRFQASSFLINLELKKHGLPCLAELNYNALNNLPVEKIKKFKIYKSFLNCNNEVNFKQFSNYEIVANGFCEFNPNSFYRKIFDYSLVESGIFEH